MNGMGNYTHQSLVYASVYRTCASARTAWRTTLLIALVYAGITIPMIIAKPERTLWTFVVPTLIAIVFGALAYAFYRRMVRAQQQLDHLTETTGVGRLWDDV